LKNFGRLENAGWRSKLRNFGVVETTGAAHARDEQEITVAMRHASFKTARQGALVLGFGESQSGTASNVIADLPGRIC
jgi:hypothetical protein